MEQTDLIYQGTVAWNTIKNNDCFSSVVRFFHISTVCNVYNVQICILTPEDKLSKTLCRKKRLYGLPTTYNFSTTTTVDGF